MALHDTTNGLTYPDGDEALASMDNAIQGLAQDVDDIVLASWTAYTPVWTGATANPAKGNGTITGAYRKRGRTVDFRIIITFGTTTTYGTGAWILTLPSAPKAGLDDVPVGSALIKRGSTRKGRVVSIDSAAASTVRAYESGATGGAVAAASEAWASGDFITLSGTYEAAA